MGLKSTDFGFNSLANTVNPSMTKACLQPCLQQIKPMVRGYCTLFLIKIDLWSRGGLPIDRSPWSMDQGSRMDWWSWLGVILYEFLRVYNIIK